MRFIGSKRNLLDNIDKVLENHLDGTEKVFVDLFGGSNVVGEYFSDRYQVISNDIMYFSFVMARGSLGISSHPTFEGLKNLGVKDPLKYLTSVDLKEYKGGYVTENFSPVGSAQRMYFTEENSKRIDYIRDKIEEWNKNKIISKNEYFYLLNSLLQAIPSISNITGTYGAYLKKWDKRAFKNLLLEEVGNLDKHKYINEEYNVDSIELIKSLKGVDIVYIDPPYNTRQYPSNYHILENIAYWNKPKLTGVTGKFNLDNEKSDFASKRKAKEAMNKLLSHTNAKHVLISYSTDGIIDKDELIHMIEKYAKGNKVEVNEIEYRKYKSKIYNNKAVYELLIYYQPKSYIESSDVAVLALEEKKKKDDLIAPKGFIKSPFNYIGGKYKLLPQITPFFPKRITTFLDMFSGGANVGINVDADKIWFNDINTKINEIFRYFQEEPIDEILNDIYNVINEYNLSKTNEKGFKQLRSDYNCNPSPVLLYVLVSYSFNYQFRFNNEMKYNNPFGKNRSHFSEIMKDNLVDFVKRLHEINALFTDKYFTKLNLDELDSNSFIYADPPYLITTGSYNDGNRGFVNWTDKQEKELYDFLDASDSRGIKFAMSNVLVHKGKENKLLKQWSSKYNIHHLDYSYKNASHNTIRGNSDEVLITNY